MLSSQFHRFTLPAALLLILLTVPGLAQEADWGNNASGQLGIGSTINSSSPAVVSGPVSAVAIAVGGMHSLAVNTGGTVQSWGLNTSGQLGNGTITSSTTPVSVSGLSGAVAVAAGSAFSLALKSDGTVRSWGLNSNGQLGDGTIIKRLTPVTVSGLTNVVAIAAGVSHALALKSDGTVWAWGRNNSGQLGDGTTTQRMTPVQVSSLTGITAIAAGSQHSLALKSDGTAWAWGANAKGEIGDGTTTNRLTPVQVSGLTNVTAVSAGGEHSTALLAAGTVWGWGANSSGQLGDGTTVGSRTTPVQAGSLTGVVAIGTGGSHTLALMNDSTVRTWGLNSSGQLGDGTTINRSTPVTVPGFLAKAIAGGTTDTAAIINQAPVADAGPDQNVTVPHSFASPPVLTTSFTLDGSASSDPDGDALTYEWSEGGTVIGMSAMLTLTRGAGTYTFMLKVTDPYGASSTDTVTVVVNPPPNRAPIAIAGPDQHVPPSPSGGPTQVTLAGGKSFDPDGDRITLAWFENGVQIATAKNAIVTLAPGIHTITLVATDNYGATGSDNVTIDVSPLDTTIRLDNQSARRGRATQTDTFLYIIGTTTRVMGRTLTLWVDGVQVATCVMAGIGTFNWTPPADMALGAHPMMVTFTGDFQYNASSQSATLTINP